MKVFKGKPTGNRSFNTQTWGVSWKLFHHQIPGLGLSLNFAKKNLYPLVDIQKTMEHHHAMNG